MTGLHHPRHKRLPLLPDRWTRVEQEHVTRLLERTLTWADVHILEAPRKYHPPGSYARLAGLVADIRSFLAASKAPR